MYDEIIVTFTDQNSRLLEMEDYFRDKVNLTSVINKLKYKEILQNQEHENMLKDMNFYRLQQNIKNNYWIQD